MKKIKLTENMIDSISMQIKANEIIEYIDNNRINYLKYLMNLMKTRYLIQNNATNDKGGVIND